MQQRVQSLLLFAGLAALLALSVPTPVQALWGYEAFAGGYYDDNNYDDDWYYDYYDYNTTVSESGSEYEQSAVSERESEYERSTYAETDDTDRSDE